MTYTKTFWKRADKQLPPDRDEEDGPKKYLVRIEKYGVQMALWYKGRFYENLAAPFENVTHWMEIPKIPLTPPELCTSDGWHKDLNPHITILDPDGWDRKNFQYSFYEESVTRRVYEDRLMRSTTIQKSVEQ